MPQLNELHVQCLTCHEQLTMDNGRPSVLIMHSRGKHSKNKHQKYEDNISETGDSQTVMNDQVENKDNKEKLPAASQTEDAYTSTMITKADELQPGKEPKEIEINFERTPCGEEMGNRFYGGSKEKSSSDSSKPIRIYPTNEEYVNIRNTHNCPPKKKNTKPSDNCPEKATTAQTSSDNCLPKSMPAKKSSDKCLHKSTTAKNRPGDHPRKVRMGINDMPDIPILIANVSKSDLNKAVDRNCCSSSENDHTSNRCKNVRNTSKNKVKKQVKNSKKTVKSILPLNKNYRQNNSCSESHERNEKNPIIDICSNARNFFIPEKVSQSDDVSDDCPLNVCKNLLKEDIECVGPPQMNTEFTVIEVPKAREMLKSKINSSKTPRSFKKFPSQSSAKYSSKQRSLNSKHKAPKPPAFRSLCNSNSNENLHYGNRRNTSLRETSNAKSDRDVGNNTETSISHMEVISRRRCKLFPSVSKNTKQLYKMDIEKLMPDMGKVKCPSCSRTGNPVYKAFKDKLTGNTWVAACFLALWPCYLLPCLLPPGKDADLYCPFCGYHFGIYNKDTKTFKRREGSSTKDIQTTIETTDE